MRKALVPTVATVVAAALLWWSLRAFGTRSIGFAFLVVWLPMTWLGTISHTVTVILPPRLHAIRRFERDGRLYERLGVRVAKRLLRRGPMSVFNPSLRLPPSPDVANVAGLERRMCEAEASHAILLVATLGVVAHAAWHGWWAAAGWTLVFDVLVNGYPVMLQRYNRVLLQRRFGGIPST